MTLHGICLEQVLVSSRVTNLDFHDKLCAWDLTHLHDVLQMLWVYQEEALVTVRNKMKMKQI